MDLNQLKVNPEQETAKQYFAKPKGRNSISGSFTGFIKYAVVSVAFVALCVGSYQLSRAIKAQSHESLMRSDADTLMMSGTSDTSRSESDLIKSIQALPAPAASMQRDLLGQIHSHNQQYQLIEHPELVVPDADQTEYPSLAMLEGKIMPRPDVGIGGSAMDEKVKAPSSKVTSNSMADDKGKVKANAKVRALQYSVVTESQPFTKESESTQLEISTSNPAQFNIQFNNKSRLANKIKAARQLYAQGKSEQAITQLKSLLSAHGKDWALNKALLHMLLKERRWQDGEALVNKLQKPNRKRLAQAQLLQARGQLNEALLTLRGDIPSVDEMPEYHQTMATLAQRLEEFPAAERIYKSLLLIDNDNGAYWLGLASAQDAMGSEKAVNSYWQARQFNIEHRSVLKYISLRIKALSKTATPEELASRQGAASL